jgi:hypothetical protein
MCIRCVQHQAVSTITSQCERVILPRRPHLSSNNLKCIPRQLLIRSPLILNDRRPTTPPIQPHVPQHLALEPPPRSVTRPNIHTKLLRALSQHDLGHITTLGTHEPLPLRCVHLLQTRIKQRPQPKQTPTLPRRRERAKADAQTAIRREFAQERKQILVFGRGLETQVVEVDGDVATNGRRRAVEVRQAFKGMRVRQPGWCSEHVDWLEFRAQLAAGKCEGVEFEALVERAQVEG